MSAILSTTKKWRVKDILRVEGAEDVVSIIKVNHPFRRQHITVIPAPRYAKEEYYMDWVYQPYVKEHKMYVSNDIYNPFYVFYCRYLIRKNRFPQYAYFHPMGFPDCVDLNLTRRQFLKREQPFKTPTSTILLTTSRFRDERHPWVPRRVLKIVGEQYVVHPSEDMQSLVFVLPPAYIPDVLNTLQSLGFNVDDSTTASIGETETLKQLNSWSNKCQLLVIGYLWLLIIMFVVGESRHVNQMFQEYKREMVIKAGKDPEQMGL